MCRTTFACVAMALIFAADAPAQPLGSAFTYQGRLEQAGSAVSGTYDLQFSLWNALAGPAQVGSTVCLDNVVVTDGLFTVPVDFGAGVFGAHARWLEIGVRPDATAGNCASGVYTTLAPRQELRPAPLALFAASVDGPSITNLNASNLAVGTVTDGRLSGNVSLLAGAQTFAGTKTFSAAPLFTSAGAPFAVTSTTLVTNLNADRLDGLHASAFLQAIPIPLTLSGSNPSSHSISGVNASAANNSYGVYGYATATSGSTYGLFGQSDSTGGRGVYGLASTSSGMNYGVYGRSDSTSGRGVYGLASATTGTNYGGYFQSDGAPGRGVTGYASATTGDTRGGYFSCWSTAGIGVHGLAFASSGTTNGGRFESWSTSGWGVYGTTSATGAGDTPYGVRGYASTATSGYAVYALGDMGASGIKPFRIDHPSDPENKYLLHYSTESPEVINFYRGNVTLDASGAAIVELPPYFAAINTTPSYQLTAIGSAMPNLHVSDEISEAALEAGAQVAPGEALPPCWFRIAGGVPGGKVSWRVEAERNDLRMRLHGAPVEREKTGPERGKYQHPEYYGQPAELGMDYRAPAQRPEVVPERNQ